MREGKFGLQSGTANKNLSIFCVTGFLSLCGMLFFSLPVFAHPAANFNPVFTGGSNQSISGCRDQNISINSYLAIIDSDAGQTETWSIAAAPLNGSLSGFSSTGMSTGGMMTPTGLSYTPATGFTGFDTFVVNVSDGIASAATTIVVHVRQLPVLSSTLTPAAICDQTMFSYVPASASGGASFAWHRNYTPGISNTTASGSGNPNETLINTTYYAVPVTYVYTTTANGCSSIQNVIVNVNPTPRLSSKLYDTTCNGASYSYIPLTPTAGTSYLWSRASVAGISPSSSSGAGNINETLISTLPSPVTVVYNFALSANGCTSNRNLNVYVIPQPPLTSISTTGPSSVCAGTMYQNFGAGIAAPAGVTYSWSTVNAEIWATGAGKQYILVSFPNPGDASVTLIINGGATSCAGNSTYSVNVGSIGSAAAGVIYYNYQLIYLDNTADSYQWGYDDVNTLDSTAVHGATFQSYPITGPDFIAHYYWVMVAKNGCMQKVYYNGPLAVATPHPATQSGIKLYPNPAGNVLNIVVAGSNGNTDVSVVNMLGQVMKTKSFTGNNVQLDISDLPAGGYMINCSQDGVKMATERFIKN